MKKLWAWLMIVGSLAMGASIVWPSQPTASAAGSTEKVFISGDNTFYLYARGGESIDATFLRAPYEDEGGLPNQDITVTLEGPGLDKKTCVISKDVPVGQGCTLAGVIAPKTGIYRLMFSLPAGAPTYREVSPSVHWGGHLYSWKVTVKDGTTEKLGRIWSELYAIRQPQRPEFMEDLTFYYVSQSGYTYKGSYKKYNGQISTLSADGVGNRKNDDCEPAYRSIEVNDTKMSPAFGECGGGYKLFFEQPAGELPQSASRWDETADWVSPAVARPTVGDVAFQSDGSPEGTQSGKIRFKLKNFVGNYKVKIDVNNDGSFDQPNDVTIKRTMKKFDDSLQEIRFSGVDAQGQVVSPTQAIGIQVVVDKVAEIHLIAGDVEAVAGGRELVRLSGDNAPTFRMCWDDTSLPRLSSEALETKKIDGRSCPDSTGGVHAWEYATGSWGDARYIDDWAFAAATVDGVTKIVYTPSEQALGLGKGRSLTPILIVGIIGGVLLVFFVGFMGALIHKNKRQKKIQAALRSGVTVPPPSQPIGRGPQSPNGPSSPWQPRQ